MSVSVTETMTQRSVTSLNTVCICSRLIPALGCTDSVKAITNEVVGLSMKSGVSPFWEDVESHWGSYKHRNLGHFGMSLYFKGDSQRDDYLIFSLMLLY